MVERSKKRGRRGAIQNKARVEIKTKLGNPNLDKVRNVDTTAARRAKLKRSNEFRAMILGKITPLINEGESLQGIVDWLNEFPPIPTIRGKKWDKTGVRRIIKKYKGKRKSLAPFCEF